MEFSVDMIRISTKVSLAEFSNFYRMISFNPEVQSFIGRGMSEYHYNFSVAENLSHSFPGFLDSDYNRFYFAYQHNSEKGNSDYGKYTFVLEYNPNKCFVDFGLLNFILKNFFNDADKIQLRSCDLCTDFDIPIDFFIYDKNRKRYTCDMTGNNGRTIYIGKRGSNGRVKIYDKAAETGITDRIWTRYEVTLTFDNTYFTSLLCKSFSVDVNLPLVYIDVGQVGLVSDAKLRAAVLCIQNGFMTINDFDRKFKQKIRSYFEGSSLLRLDDNIKNDLSITIVNYVRDLSIQFTDYRLLKK